MQSGQGSIGKSVKNPPSGPPFPVGSANNGLSVDPVTGEIVLGNDVGAMLAALLSAREIPMDGFSLRFLQDNANNSEVRIQPDPVDNTLLLAVNSGTDLAGLSASFGVQPSGIIAQAFGLVDSGDLGITETVSELRHSQAVSLEITSPYPQGSIRAGITGGNNFLLLDILNEFYGIGDLNSAGNGLKMTFDDPTQVTRIESLFELFLFLSPQVYTIGNVNDTLNGSKMSIDDVNRAMVFSTVADGRRLALEGLLGWDRMGDIDALLNGTVFQIDDLQRLTTIGDNAGAMFVLDRINEMYQFGDVSVFGNGTRLNIQDAQQAAIIEDALGTMLVLDRASSQFSIGDIDQVLNGTSLQIDDANAAFVLDNTAHNSGIIINGVAGFTGTVTPVTSITVNGGIVTAVA